MKHIQIGDDRIETDETSRYDRSFKIIVSVGSFKSPNNACHSDNTMPYNIQTGCTLIKLGDTKHGSRSNGGCTVDKTVFIDTANNYVELRQMRHLNEQNVWWMTGMYRETFNWSSNTDRLWSPPNIVHRVSQEERTKLWEGVPYVKLYRYNPKRLYPKLNGYGDNGQRKVWTSCISAYSTSTAV